MKLVFKYILGFLFIIYVILVFVAAINKADTGPYEFTYPDYFGNRISIPEDNPATKEGVYLGRLLFYEKMLSSDNSISCGTCHQQKLAFTDGKQFSTGVDGLPTSRNAMSLANLLWVRSFFWDGRTLGLEEQAQSPLNDPHEMGGALEEAAIRLGNTKKYPDLFRGVFGSKEITGDRIVKAIAQFERTLISADSKYDKYLQGKYQPSNQELRGIELFMNHADTMMGARAANCGQCHGTPKIFMELFHNNGLDSVHKDSGREKVTGLLNDKGRFRVVTLRNIELTAPYMHDGRFKTLEEVLDHYSEHIQFSKSLSPFLRSKESGVKSLQLSKQEKEDIISFLKMLTDSSFISNPEFSDPGLIKVKRGKALVVSN